MVCHGIIGLPVVVSGVRAIGVELDRWMKVERWTTAFLGMAVFCRNGVGLVSLAGLH